jgi:hypothetical protein
MAEHLTRVSSRGHCARCNVWVFVRYDNVCKACYDNDPRKSHSDDGPSLRSNLPLSLHHCALCGVRSHTIYDDMCKHCFDNVKVTCDICTEPFRMNLLYPCMHSFCRQCWEAHVTNTLRTTHIIRCPGHGCTTCIEPRWLSGYAGAAVYDAVLARQAEAHRSATSYLLSSTVMNCPGCNVPIVRDGGCQEMACSCGIRFIWRPGYWKKRVMKVVLGMLVSALVAFMVGWLK